MARVCLPPVQRRVRHVPRQASAVNLSTRVSNAELARLKSELEQLRSENRRLSGRDGAKRLRSGLQVRHRAHATVGHC